MKKTGKTRVVLFLAVAILVLLGADGTLCSEETMVKKRIVLIGASVGKKWDLYHFPERTGLKQYTFEYMGCYRFDKGEVYDKVLEAAEKPDAVILKECAAYFPSDVTLDEAKRLMIGWIEAARARDVTLIPATVVSVTAEHDEAFKTTNPLKRMIKRLIGKNMQTRQERIAEYNDWLKAYCDREGIPCLDLETPLLRNSEERYLSEEFTSGDGLHLNEKAYALLDRQLIATLEKVFP